jgi:coenzyme Q-binding protein COQ10
MLIVHRSLDAGEDTKVLIADMTVAYGPMRETFKSQVTLNRPQLTILVEYLDGPFRQLENRWRFKADGEQRSEIDFFISYEFRSKALGLLMGAVFDTTFRRMVEAFEKRADTIYHA